MKSDRRKYSDYVAVNVNTGEIEKNIIICSKADAEARQKYMKSEEEVQTSKRNKAERRFIWSFFNNTRYLEGLQPQTAARLAYISTYLGYNDNFLREHDDIISRQEFKSLMKLKEGTFRDFLKQAKDAHYIIKETPGYRINSRYYKKGEITSGDMSSDTQAIRLYINTYRKLYKNTPAVKHVYLGYIFQLIPYVNREFNVICHNPLETNRDNIDPVTICQFCDLIGYDRTHASRLINVYRDIVFEWQGKEQPLLRCIKIRNSSKPCLCVNPLIFFAGNDYHRNEIVGKYFM